jgi:cell division protein FtsQ
VTATSHRTTAGSSSVGPGHRKGSRRRRSPRRRGTWLWGSVAGVMVLSLLAGAGWLVGFSQVLAARRIEVTGLDRVEASSIREAAAVPLGLPLARQDLGAIASRVSSLPRIESAEVSRQWPRTIRIAVVERRPLLGVRQPEGFLLVDAQGVAFETSPSLPTGVLQADINPDRVQLLVEAGTIAAAMPPDLKRRVVRMHATSRNHVMVLLTDRTEVNWGTDVDSVLKSQLVLALLKRKPSMIDVSSPHTPAVR